MDGELIQQPTVFSTGVSAQGSPTVIRKLCADISIYFTLTLTAIFLFNIFLINFILKMSTLFWN